jgi:hypothetical protein
MGKIEKKFLAIAILGLSLATLISGTAFAATKKKRKINTVSFKVMGNIDVDTQIGMENLDFTTSAGTYHVENFEVQNQGFKWTMNDVPEYKVTLTAEDEYEFNVKKASDLNIVGASYVSSITENSRTNLVVTVKLPSLKNQVSAITEAKMEDDGSLSWSVSKGAGSYEVKFYRGQSLLGGILKSNTNTLNVREYMQKAGSYYFLVRPINAINTDVAGDWFESNRISLDSEQAELNKTWYDKVNTGSWGQTSTGDWYYILSNNTLARSEWKKIKGEWYYFEDNAYMAKGWLENSGKWYYLDPENGKMWKNTTTPDGYTLGIDGSMATGNAISR